MAFADLGNIASGGNKTAGTTLTVATTASVAATDLVIVAFAGDNIQTTDGASTLVSGVTIGGNACTKLEEQTKGAGAAGAGATLSLWYLRAAGTIASGQNIVVTHTSITAHALTARNFSTGAAVQDDGGHQTNFTTAGTGVTETMSGLSNVEHLFIEALATESTGAISASANYTAFTTGSSGGSPTATTMSVGAQFRVLTGTGDTAGMTDNAGAGPDRVHIMVAMSEVAPAPLPPDVLMAPIAWPRRG